MRNFRCEVVGAGGAVGDGAGGGVAGAADFATDIDGEGLAVHAGAVAVACTTRVLGGLAVGTMAVEVDALASGSGGLVSTDAIGLVAGGAAMPVLVGSETAEAEPDTFAEAVGCSAKRAPTAAVATTTMAPTPKTARMPAP